MVPEYAAQAIVPQCRDCALVDFTEGTCTAFVDPAYQHRDGRKCWGRCDTAREMVRRLEAMVAYSPGSKVCRRELERWTELTGGEVGR
jgi:hypothetical protein